MEDVTKHYTEQEGEGNHGENGGVHLFIVRNTIGVNKQLEGVEEIIFLKCSWSGQTVFVSVNFVPI